MFFRSNHLKFSGVVHDVGHLHLNLEGKCFSNCKHGKGSDDFDLILMTECHSVFL